MFNNIEDFKAGEYGIQNKKIKDNQFLIRLFENCKYIKCCINKKLLKKKLLSTI